jgi:two-component system, NtrC family, sensor kinase
MRGTCVATRTSQGILPLAGKEQVYVRPFKLHVKTTLIVSAAVIAIFSTVGFFYYQATRELEQQHTSEQYKEQALTRAVQFAELISTTSGPLSPEQAERLVERLRHTGSARLSLVQLYDFTGPGGPFNPASVASPPDKAHPLRWEQITELLTGAPLTPEEASADGSTGVWTAAPIVVAERTIFGDQKRTVGAVLVKLDVPKGTLADRLNRFTIASMALVVVVVAVATYLLFRRLVYKPIDALLIAMARVEEGNLSVNVPPRARDEVGLLTIRFNRMVDRLREFADERAAHARQLETRVQEATVKLADQNDQLAAANIQLFDIQHRLGQMERLATAGQLAAQFAHEVGTPLNLISGHVQLLRARATDERSIKRLEIIASQITRIERIVRGMLDQTRRPAPRFEPVELGALVARIVETIAPTLAARRVDLDVAIEPNLPPVDADADQLQQVFINLVNNSLDAMPDGGRVRVEATRSDDEITIRLSDTGHGIDEADIPYVFDALFTTKDRGRGSGLGLTVSQDIVREHGGRIEVTSQPNAGTTFTLTLPVKEVLSAEISAEC